MFEKTKKWVEDHKEGLKTAGDMIGCAAMCVAAGLIGVYTCRKFEPFGKLSRAGINPELGVDIADFAIHSNGYALSHGSDPMHPETLKEAAAALLRAGEKHCPDGEFTPVGLIAFMRKE